MFKFSILNTPSFEIDQNILDIISTNIESVINKTQKWNLNIIFVEKKEIKNLNKNYRWIDKETDVLSFHYFDNFEELDENDTAWEIVMLEEKIKTQWVEYWLWEIWEFYKLVIHSTLHILWYDHEEEDEYKQMQKLENIIWEKTFGK